MRDLMEKAAPEHIAHWFCRYADGTEVKIDRRGKEKDVSKDVVTFLNTIYGEVSFVMFRNSDRTVMFSPVFLGDEERLECADCGVAIGYQGCGCKNPKRKKVDEEEVIAAGEKKVYSLVGEISIGVSDIAARRQQKIKCSVVVSDIIRMTLERIKQNQQNKRCFRLQSQ